MIEQMKENKKKEFNFDVYNTVKQLKQQRIGMIQKKEQYIFTYQTILEHAQHLGWKFE
jgi:protein tyrosine phosphatase